MAGCWSPAGWPTTANITNSAELYDPANQYERIDRLNDHHPP